VTNDDCAETFEREAVKATASRPCPLASNVTTRVFCVVG
jgi:hypothetical protein